MSNLYGGKTLIDIIEQQKVEERTMYQHRQELQCQQDKRIAAEQKANEKSDFEKLLDKQKAVKELLEGTPAGYYRYQENINEVLKRMCGIIDALLEAHKPDESEKTEG